MTSDTVIQQPEQYYGTGRRKTATARVFLRMAKTPGAPQVTVNRRAPDEYFRCVSARHVMLSPLRLLEKEQDFDIKITVKGGGNLGQADAVRHGVSRALLQYDETLRPQLRQAGMLTRDARAVERKKIGLRKARKRPQYSKR